MTEEINSVAIFQDSIYATNGQVVYTAYTKSNFLSNPNQWRTNKDFKTANNARFAQLLTVGENLCVLKKGNTTGKDSVFQYKANALEILTDFSFDINIQSISSLDNKLGLNLMDGIIGFNQDFIGIAYVLQKLNENTILNVNHSLFHEGKVYAGTVNNGLVELDPSGGGSKVSFEGPARNTYWRMSTGKDLLLVSGGGLNGNFSTYNPNGNYLLKDGSWSLLNRETVPEWNDKIIYDFIGSAINPITGEFAISTYSHEPVTTFDAQGNVKGVFNPNNSTLEYTVLGNGNSYVSDMVYDDNGNLWSLNGYAAEGLLKCLSKEGNWYSYSLGANTIGFRTEELVMDYNGNLWASVLNKGLVGYNFGGTVDNLSDDKRINLDVGETTGALPSNLVNTIAVDFDNEIWIGTDNGFAILYNSQGAFDAVPGEYNAQRIKLEFEGNVEFLLGSTSITSIVVDGGNRKWLGTAGAGVFCLSPDGLQILENFTSENSPLISDFIVDMEMDHNTGELYIITDKGLVSTRVDASYEDPDYEDVVVFPNPAGPNFSGPITIQGIKFDSDVKITDAGGNLVYRTTSNGGTATWNGKTLEGEKAVTGIYYIWTASNEQKGRKVAKVALINAQ